MEPANVRLDSYWFERGPVLIGFQPFFHFFGRNHQYAMQKLSGFLHIHDIFRNEEHFEAGPVIYENSPPSIQDHSSAGWYLADSYPIVF